jgi:hypothetical protein
VRSPSHRTTCSVSRKSSFFGGRSEPKNAEDLAAALLAQKGDERPTADVAARLLRSFAA